MCAQMIPNPASEIMWEPASACACPHADRSGGRMPLPIRIRPSDLSAPTCAPRAGMCGHAQAETDSNLPHAVHRQCVPMAARSASFAAELGVLRRVAYVVSAAILMAGCSTERRSYQEYTSPSSPISPRILHCCFATGHVKGAVPWILGGTCCCTPTRAKYDVHVTEGTMPTNMTYEMYLGLYAQRHITTDLDHVGCNNLCADGPHVVLHGHCMATPVCGTPNFEKVVFGIPATLHVTTQEVKEP